MHLLLPFFAAIAFGFGALLYKRAFAEGASVAHGVVANNVALGAIFLPLLWVEPGPVPWQDWHRPVLTGLAYLIGHLLNIVSLRAGDVSIATPLLGAKVIFVGLIGWLAFGTQLTTAQWLASALATAGVFVMGATEFHKGRGLGVTTISALGCAASFALTDVLIQAWAAEFGPMRFLALQFAALGLLSLALLPGFGWRSLRASRTAWKWIAAATAFSALQAILITSAIAIWKDAAGVNVIYATRGLWSIAFVWSIGPWMKNTERATVGRQRMACRFAGALLIVLGVFLTAREAKQ